VISILQIAIGVKRDFHQDAEGTVLGVRERRSELLIPTGICEVEEFD
jgi:hypothetical protein